MAIQSKSVMQISAAALFLTITAVIGMIGYILITDPHFNHIEKNKNQLRTSIQDAAKELELKKWNWQYYDDVSVNNDKYPIVVLKTGYKILKIKEGKAFVGWNYQVMNTSPSARYVATINYHLTDPDGFKINGSRQESDTAIDSESYYSIRDVVEIDKEDIPRLSGSSWTISLSPDWKTKEKNTKGTRYERLARIVSENKAPWWVYEKFDAKKEPELIDKISEKWLPVIQSLRLQAGKEQVK